MYTDRVRRRMRRGKNGYIGEVYLAQDSDFESISGYWVYKGEPLEVDITNFVNNKNLTTTYNMFSGASRYGSTAVKRVVLGENSVTDMSYMFNYSKTSLDLSSFDTSSVTRMFSMFRNSRATSLDLSSFDTSSVTSMSYMFYDSQATSLDLSSFDTSSVTSMSYMFNYSQATTGYARTQADADKFNSSRNKPAGLNFVVKP